MVTLKFWNVTRLFRNQIHCMLSLWQHTNFEMLHRSVINLYRLHSHPRCKNLEKRTALSWLITGHGGLKRTAKMYLKSCWRWENTLFCRNSYHVDDYRLVIILLYITKKLTLYGFFFIFLFVFLLMVREIIT